MVRRNVLNVDTVSHRSKDKHRASRSKSFKGYKASVSFSNLGALEDSRGKEPYRSCEITSPRAMVSRNVFTVRSMGFLENTWKKKKKELLL